MSELEQPAGKLTNPQQWVDLHGDSLYRYAMRWIGDPQAAQDLVQETFLAALEAKERFGGQSSERTWLVAILKNKIIDHLRRVGRERPLENDGDALVAEHADFRTTGLWTGSWKSGRRPAEWLIDASDRLEREEFWRHLRRCLEALPARAAQVFVSREMDEMESGDICNRFGLTPTNLRVLLHRTRLQLRHCLEVNWIAEEGRE